MTYFSHGEIIQLELAVIYSYAMESNKPENEAAAEWITHHAPDFREKWSRKKVKSELLRLMKDEIARHRWIESQKKGMDLGKKAEIDWIKRFAKAFFSYHLGPQWFQ
ncbi:MAG TPA: hypothetical protein PK360_06515 [bacterium]|nr:hypothetical protein [bacterium]